MKRRYLTLASGAVFEGWAFGADLETVGELVFTTGMTGYIETLNTGMLPSAPQRQRCVFWAVPPRAGRARISRSICNYYCRALTMVAPCWKCWMIGGIYPAGSELKLSNTTPKRQVGSYRNTG